MRNRALITVTILVAAILSVGRPNSGTAFAALQVNDLQDLQNSYSPRNENSTPAGQRGDELREEFHETYPIAPNGRVSLENLNGGVRISVSDKNEVQVNAVKKAYNRERLNEAKIEVSSTADAIRIRTTYPNRHQNYTNSPNDDKGRYNNPAVVEYSLIIPRQARIESVDLVNGSLDIEGVEGDVKASTVNGRVSVRGLKGEAKVNTVNGELDATFTQLSESKPVSLGSVNGSVVVVIPSDSNAILRAETIDGAIENDFGLEVEDGEYVGHSLFGQLGSGGPRIKLSNVNGEITIKHAQDGRPLSLGTNLLSQKDKDKEKDKSKGSPNYETGMTAEEARELAEKIKREVMTELDEEKIRRQVEPEARRAAQRALREAEREIRQAQQEVQREQRRQIREQIRGKGRGEGQGEGIGEGIGVGGGLVTAQEAKSFPVTGGARVNIGTYDGNVTVHGWNKSEVMYTANKRANDEQELKGIRIETEQQGSSVSIIAKSDPGDGTVNLEVFVPRNSTVHVSSGDGALKLQGVSGELTLRTGDGSIHVSDSQGQIQVNTGDGSIHISNFEGQADARTGDGSIMLDGKFTSLAAQTGDGEVSLSVARDSNFTIETDTKEISNEGLSLSEDVAPSNRAKRWKVGRGGSVFVIGTGGEGRIVIRAR